MTFRMHHYNSLALLAILHKALPLSVYSRNSDYKLKNERDFGYEKAMHSVKRKFQIRNNFVCGPRIKAYDMNTVKHRTPD